MGDRIFRIDVECLGELLQVMELRICVEAEAAALTAQRRTPDQMQELERVYASFLEDVEAGGAAAEQDIAFHALIAVLSGNEYFDRFIRYLSSRLFVPGQRVFTYRNGLYEHMRGIASEHEAIIAAIRDGSPDKARQSMRRHLECSLARYRAAMKGKKDGFPLN